MPVLLRDFETRSVLDLKEVGAWQYSRHATTDILCVAYAVDDGPIQLWKPGDPVPPEFIEAARNPEWLVSAYNDTFERYIEQHVLAPRYGFPLVPLERHRCLQAGALALALPGSLENVAKALSLSQQKDEAGKRAMLTLTRPRKARPGDNGIHWSDDPELFEQLYAYCRQDVATERELHQHVPFVEGNEQALWVLDQQINDRGVHIDRPLVEAALKLADQAHAAINAEIAEITAGEVTSVAQVKRILAWLNDHGAQLKNIGKKALEKALAKELPDMTRRVIQLRLEGAHAAADKLYTMRAWLDADNRARGCLKYHGASTGRWSSWGIQLQNMKKPLVDDIDAAIAVVSTGDLEQVRQHYPQPVSVVGDVTRGMITAAPGHRLLCADLSGIESRVLAWVSGQASKLEMWRRFDETGKAEDEPYFLIGKALGVPAEKARSVGKTADLAFGFMGGVNAWKKFEETTSDEEIEKHKRRWRDTHPQTVEFWRALNAKAIKAVRVPGQRHRFQNPIWPYTAFEVDGAFLYMHLPSGRRIAYPQPRLITTSRGAQAVSFMDWTVRGWGECRFGQGAYGGTWIENCVQAIARDVFANAMPRLEAAGYRIILTIHDEIVAEVPDGFGSLEEFIRILTTPPAWAPDLPLAAKGRNGLRFSKSNVKRAERVEPDPIDELTADPPFDPDPNPQPEHEPEPEPICEDRGGGHARDDYAAGEEPKGRKTAAFIYEDERAEPYQEVTKYGSGDNKSFPQRFRVNGKWVRKKPEGWRWLPYRLPQLIAAKPDVRVCIPEGEKDAERLAGLGFIATCNPGGATKWGGALWKDLSKWFAGRQQVFIFEDNDAPGREHARKVADALYGIALDIRIVKFPELPDKGDVSDWLDQRHTREELLARMQAAPKFERTPDQLQSTRAASIEITALEWIWLYRFAIGKLGLIVGLPDEGKGLFLADIAARVTRGLPWPCGEGFAPRGNVLLLSAEDDPSDTVVPRLIAAGADLERIEIVSMVRADNKDRMFSLVTDLELLRAKIAAVGDVRLVQIDPISAYLGVGKIDSFRTTDVRAVLSPLVSLAAELRVGVTGIMHFNKKVDVTNALLRISDSLAFGATSRHVYAVVDDRENHRKLVVRGKNNLAPPDQKALAFEFDSRKVGVDAKTGEEIRAPHIVWQSQHVDVTATEAMLAAAESKAPAARDAAKIFLKETLADGPIASDEVEEAAAANGIAERTLYRAKADLKIRAVKDGPMKDGQRTWRWHPPAKV
jgi:DNA polymerase